MQYCLSDKPAVMPFDPFRASIQPYPITNYQPTYFLAESFKDATEKLRFVQLTRIELSHLLLACRSSQYAATIPRPFTVHYNPYTQNMEVIDGKEQIVNIVRALRSKREKASPGLPSLFARCPFADDMDIVLDALRKTDVAASHST